MIYCKNIEKHMKKDSKNNTVFISRDNYFFPTGFKYCTECGEKLMVKTDKCVCGQERTDYKYCPFCGIKN